MEGGKRRYTEVVGEAGKAHDLAVAERDRVARAKGRVLTLGDGMQLVRDDIAARGLSSGTAKWYEDHFAALLTVWDEGSVLSRIDVAEVEHFIRVRRKDGVTPNGIQHDLRALSRVFSLAMRKEAVTFNPVALATKPKATEPEYHVLEWGEALGMCDRIGEALASDLARFLLHSGLRRAEAGRLLREHVSRGDLPTLTVEGKTGRRILPAPPGLLDLVDRMRSAHDGPGIVPGRSEYLRTETVRRLFDRAKAQLGEPRWHPHTMRHTFASELARRGTPEQVIADLMGHKRKRSIITQRYITVFGDQMRAAMSMLWHEGATWSSVTASG